MTHVSKIYLTGEYEMEFSRKVYLERLNTRKNNGLIKIVTGVRRAGKSYLLNEIFYNDLIKNSVKKKNIIKFAFDSDEDIDKLNGFCKAEPTIVFDENKKKKVSSKKFRAYISSHINDEENFYLLLDEVQLLENFESVLNGYLRHHNLDVYVTGSNSKFLSKDVITEFKSRGDEIHVLPLTFSEYVNGFNTSKHALWNEYTVFGGIPQVALMQTDEQKTTYLKKLCQNLYISDIVERYNLRSDEEISDIFNIIASGIGSLVNPPKLSRTFLSIKNKKISVDSITKYIEYLSDSFIVSKSLRYDVKGKNYINTPYKLYFEDIGIRNARIDFRQVEETHIMENIIYNELRYRGYNVDVGVVEIRESETKNGERIFKRTQTEVDFIATLGSRKYYIQSALHMDTQEKIDQETKSLKNIDDSFKKIIVVKDDIKPRQDENGFMIMNIFDFLLNANSLNM